MALRIYEDNFIECLPGVSWECPSNILLNIRIHLFTDALPCTSYLETASLKSVCQEAS